MTGKLALSSLPVRGEGTEKVVKNFGNCPNTTCYKSQIELNIK